MGAQAGRTSRPKTSVYVGVSLDGFIARAGGEVDFLDSAEPLDGDLGFSEFMSTVDALVMGRNTADFVLEGGYDWPYGDTPVFVLTSRELRVPKGLEGLLEPVAAAPGELLAELAGRGIGHVYVDGGITVQSFLRAGLIDEIVMTFVPVLVGAGIRLFGELDGDVLLRHLGTTTFDNGLLKAHYAVVRESS